MSSDLVVGLELVAEDCVNKWRTLLGPTNSTIAKQEAPTSIRALFGTDATKNAAHGSDSLVSAMREL
jgi:nucleoside-diphosphate kinase